MVFPNIPWRRRTGRVPVVQNVVDVDPIEVIVGVDGGNNFDVNGDGENGDGGGGNGVDVNGNRENGDDVNGNGGNGDVNGDDVNGNGNGGNGDVLF
jgi:hypothetical protein